MSLDAYLVFLEFIQGVEDVVHEGHIPYDPRIVECRRESKLISIERIGLVDRDKESVRIRIE